MAEIVQSLFGVTPEMYQQSQQARADQQALQYAQLTPFQQANFAIGRGANMLGGAIGGALGAQDPQLALISARQQISNQINYSDPESIVKGVDMLSRAGDTQGAMMLADVARKAQSESALTQQRLRERAAADPFQKLVESGKYTPASLAEYQRTGLPADLVLYEKPEKPEKPVAPKIDKIGVAGGSNKAVFLDVNNDLQFIYDKDATGKQVRVPYTGPVDQTISKVSATATSAGSKKGAEAIAELDSKRLNAAQVASGKAVEQAGLLQELLKTPQPISGSGAPARVGALRVFSTFGLTSSKDNEALGNADKFNALAGERVISFIKALGSNPTDTDREFARTIGPALEKGTKTNTDLINFLLERSRKVVVDASEMEKHFYENDYSLRGFKSPFLTDIDKPKASNMSAEDLAKAAGGKLVNGKFVKD
jgi:hypothetical protein